MENIKVLYKKETSDKVYIIAASTKTYCECPSCGVKSIVKHSKYVRKIADGSLNGVPNDMLLVVGKFKCNNEDCNRKIFTERLSFVSLYGRKSNKLIEFIMLLALTTSAQKVSTIMRKLGVRVSDDTIIRIIKKLDSFPSADKDNVVNIGVDDIAFKKGNRYGTIICNLDTKQIIDVLPSRTKEDLANWLKQYPNIKLVSRDGSLSYAAAIIEAAPNARQVSDKFHLIKNLLDAFGSYIKRSYHTNIPLKDDPVIKEDFKEIAEIKESNNIVQEQSNAEYLRQQKVDAKWNLINEIQSRHNEGTSIRQLSREFTISRNTVKKYLKADSPIYYTPRVKRGSKLDEYKETIIDLLVEGKTHQEITNVLKQQGYDGSCLLLSSYMSKNNIKRTNIKVSGSPTLSKTVPELKPQTINRNYIIKCIFKNTDRLTEAEANCLDKITEEYPQLKEIYMLIRDFKILFKDCNQSNLDSWIDKARSFKIHEVDSYTNGILRDIDAVRNSIVSKYTNGFLEGTINKVKVIKRISYGRCNFNLLRTKILYA